MLDTKTTYNLRHACSKPFDLHWYLKSSIAVGNKAESAHYHHSSSCETESTHSASQYFENASQSEAETYY